MAEEMGHDVFAKICGLIPFFKINYDFIFGCSGFPLQHVASSSLCAGYCLVAVRLSHCGAALLIIYLFIWLLQVLVVARGIIVGGCRVLSSCGVWD